MIELIEGAANPACGALLTQMFRLRHDVFVKEMKWTLNCPDGEERDQFDTDETMYLVELDEGRGVVACVRMNACDKPTMLSAVFADMCDGGAPGEATRWELSRGAIAARARRHNNFGQIECATLEAALIYGATMACGLFGAELLAKKIRSGLQARHLGAPRVLEGELCVAAEFPLDREVLARTRALYRITAPALSHLHLKPRQRAAA
jgi:acyl-homoserine lactone synthase